MSKEKIIVLKAAGTEQYPIRYERIERNDPEREVHGHRRTGAGGRLCLAMTSKDAYASKPVCTTGYCLTPRDVRGNIILSMMYVCGLFLHRRHCILVTLGINAIRSCKIHI